VTEGVRAFVDAWKRAADGQTFSTDDDVSIRASAATSSRADPCARLEPSTDSRIIEEFCGLVRDLHHEDMSHAKQPAYALLERCVEETYRLLADVLRPVL
jgi:hypothetical protein